MKLYFLTFLFITSQIVINAQRISADDYKQLQAFEKNLQANADSIIESQDVETRFANSKEMVVNLVKALKVKNSFFFNFDSVRMSKLYAPDSTFKIFTWQVTKDSHYCRQYGALQMNTKDGSLKLFPLFDCSDFTERPFDSVRSHEKWIGAVYYKIIQKKYNNKNIYTLLGSDANDEFSMKKWMEILTFDNEGKPVFGGNYFVYKNDGIKPPQPCYRFCLEFKKNGGARLMYNEKLDVVIFDHLVSENNDVALHHTLIPYGDYEGFKWNNGKWYFTAQPFDALDFEKPVNMTPKPLNFKKEQ